MWSRCSYRSSGSLFRKREELSSAKQWVRMSLTVNLRCLLDGTKMTTGLDGEYSLIAMAIIREGKWGIEKDWIWMAVSKGRALTAQWAIRIQKDPSGCKIKYCVRRRPSTFQDLQHWPRIRHMQQYPFCFRSVVPHTEYTVRWPDFATNHLNFICDQEPEVLNVLRCLHLLETTSDIPLETTHIRTQTIMEPIKNTCVGVQTITSPFSSKRKSALVSPVRLAISFPLCNFPNFAFHSFTRSSTISW